MGHFEKGRWVIDEPIRSMEITINTQTALDIMLLKLALAEMNSSEIPISSESDV